MNDDCCKCIIIFIILLLLILLVWQLTRTTPAPSCVTDADCAAEEMCVDGNCVPIPTCVLDLDPITIDLTDIYQACMINQADGKIILFNNTLNGLERYDVDGTFDSAFGTVGLAPTPSSLVDRLQVDINNNIYAYEVGATSNIAKYLSDGTPDATFGVAGVLTYPSTNGSFTDMYILDDGTQIFGNVSLVGLLELDATGVFVPTFNTNTALTMDATYFNEVVEVFDNKVYAYNRRDILGDFFASIIRFNRDGTVDPTYGTGGEFLLDFVTLGLAPSNLTDSLFGSLILPDGSSIIAGCASFDAGTSYLPFVAKVTPNGQLDTTFGTNGVTIDNIYTTSSLFSRITRVGMYDLFADRLIFIVTDFTNGTVYFLIVNGDGTINQDRSFTVVNMAQVGYATFAPGFIYVIGSQDPFAVQLDRYGCQAFTYAEADRPW